MKRILKYILTVLGLGFITFFVGFGSKNSEAKFYGEFGDGTIASDTVCIHFSTWDTLGYSADADTYFVRRFYHGNLIDSTFGTATTNKVRTGYYEVKKRALTGTSYGQYEVEIEWHKQTKAFKISGTYVVRDGDVENAPQNIENIKTKTDQLTFATKGIKAAVKELDEDSATIDLDGSTIGTATDVTSDVSITQAGADKVWNTTTRSLTDKADFSLTSDYMTKADSGATGASYLRVKYVEDKTGYSLTPSYMTKADSSLYMRTDWGNIKNQNAIVDFNRTHIAYVETVDSINEEIIAEVDTSQIKTMNENNQWGASYTWDYESRTLTSGAGFGANSVVVRCKQSSDSANIALTQIQVLDSLENSTIGLLTSDSQGRGFFALDNGTYCVRMYKPGWQFTVPETLKVSGDEDTTYYADPFDPGLPPQATLCRVYGWIYGINNQPEEGAKVEASIRIIPLRYQNIVISPYYKSTTTDEDGYWYLDLYPNSVLSPSGTRYIFFLYSPSGTILRIETTVPDQGSWELQW